MSQLEDSGDMTLSAYGKCKEIISETRWVMSAWYVSCVCGWELGGICQKRITIRPVASRCYSISNVTSWCILKVLRMTVTLGNPQTCWIKWSETDDFAFFSMHNNCLYIEMSMSCIGEEHSNTVWIEIFQKLIVWQTHLVMQGGLVSTWHACGAYVYICTVHV